MGFVSLGTTLQKQNFSRIRHKRQGFQRYTEIVNKNHGSIGYTGKRNNGYKSIMERFSIWLLMKLGVKL